MTSRQETLRRLITTHKWTHGAELGVYEGATSEYLLRTCPGLNLICVDRWQAYGPGQRQNKQTGEATYTPHQMAAAREKAIAVLEKYLDMNGGRCRLFEAETSLAALAVQDGSLDFVFIDGDHTTAGVLRDIDAWEPKVREGGAVLGHDADWPAVRAAYAPHFPNVAVLPGNIWMARIN